MSNTIVESDFTKRLHKKGFAGMKLFSGQLSNFSLIKSGHILNPEFSMFV